MLRMPMPGIGNLNYTLYKQLRLTLCSEDDIERYATCHTAWRVACCFQKLSEAFIAKHADEVDWYYVCSAQKLSEGFIERFSDKVNWEIVAIYQKLSEAFVEKHFVSIWDFANYQKLSAAFRSKHHIELPKHNWLYKSTAFKKKAVQDTGLYECHKDYFIAYKAIRRDRYSLFNFQYKYEKGGVYETHADYTDAEDSFGFGAGTESFALDYGYNSLGEGMLVRVKIYYKDVARVLYGGRKIRACKIEVLY